MKTAMAILSTVLAVGVIGGGAALFGAYRSNTSLQDENRRLTEALRVAEAQSAALHTEKQEGHQKLAAAQELSSSLLNKLSASETTEPANSKNAGPPEVRAYQAPAYIGKTLLGPVWVVPQNLRKDTNSQRYVYDQVVVLDERYRETFVTHHTNIVEREIATTYVDNNYNTTYYPQPVYYYGGGRPPHGTNHNPNPGPLPPQVPTPTPKPTPNVNSGAGKTTPQKLWIPADQIKTLPIGK